MDLDVFHQTWIAPDMDFDRCTVSIKRLAKNLDYNRSLYRISDDFAGEPVYENSLVSLWKGDGVQRTLNKANNKGLILEIGGYYMHAILSGDCEYLSWPPELTLGNNDVLIVPHHGSAMDCTRISGMKKRVAVISAGQDSRKFGWIHPDLKHITTLQNHGYKVMEMVRGSREFMV